jgi:hypothetical protein
MDGSGPGTRSLYEADEHAWMLQQLALLNQGRVHELDATHLAEYLRDMTKSDRRALRSHLTRLFQHLLKFEAQPGRATRSWRLSVIEQQQRVHDDLKDTPSLANYLPELLPDAYATARRFAAQETGLPLSAFPAELPWSLDAALAWEPPEPTTQPRRRR